MISGIELNGQVKVGLPEGGKARRVYLMICDQISNGTYAPDCALPGEQRLAEQYNVSRVTVRRALDAVVADGLVVRRSGAGTFVCPANADYEPVAVDFTTLIPQLVDMGQNTTARLLSFSYGTAPQHVARDMNLANDQSVQIATRIRLIDGRPFSHLTTYVPKDIATSYTEEDLASTPLFKLLERSGVRVRDAHQSVTATLASPDVAEALGVADGSALLSLKRVLRDAQGRGVEYLAALYRADMFRLEMTLNRVHGNSTRQWEPVISDAAPSEGAQ